MKEHEQLLELAEKFINFTAKTLKGKEEENK